MFYRKMSSKAKAASIIVIISLSYSLLHLVDSQLDKTKQSIMEFEIKTTWDGKPLKHEGIKLKLEPYPQHVKISILAPFFNDPPAPPGGIKGEPYDKLWDYEVVEAFFLGEKDRYLETEFSPHGEHLLLLLDGQRNAIKTKLPLKYTSSINGSEWTGEAYIPIEYFPPHITKFNAYAISGSSEKRIYKSLYPVEEGKYDAPDFHKLEYFKSIDFHSLIPDHNNDKLSKVWEDALKVKDGSGSQNDSCDKFSALSFKLNLLCILLFHFCAIF